jgi:hypothetical protein
MKPVMMQQSTTK